MQTKPVSQLAAMNLSSTDSYVLFNFQLMSGILSQAQVDALEVRNARICRVGQLSEMPDNCQHVDLGGLNLSPGFIDLQLNGCGGVMFNQNISVETLDIMHLANLNSGCTSFLPTLTSTNNEEMFEALDVVRDYRNAHPERVPGIHLEGPYLNPERKGIHNKRHLRLPSTDVINTLCKNADIIRMITLAPEVCPSGMIEQLCESGIVVSIGHSNATCEEVITAERAGARFVTHLYNAMSQLGSREPGVVGAVFDSATIRAGIIADGFHLAWQNLRIAHQLLQDRLVLVTDSTAPAGTNIKTFEFAGEKIYHKGGKCVSNSGTLAGSALTMIMAVVNCIRERLPVDAVIRMATVNAAQAIHYEHLIGRISSGQYANLVFFDDKFILKGTVSGGEIVCV